MSSNLGFSGALKIDKHSRPGPGLVWHLKNRTRFAFWFSWLAQMLAYWFSRATGIVTICTEVRAIKYLAAGGVVDYGALSYRFVTTAGVGFMASDFNSTTSALNTLNFHGVGTGTVAENVADTALGANATPGTNFVAGTKSNPSANVYQTSVTLNFTATANISEHGLFNQTAPTGAKLWDRSVFPAIPVQSGDSITLQYQLTINAGG